MSDFTNEDEFLDNWEGERQVKQPPAPPKPAPVQPSTAKPAPSTSEAETVDEPKKISLPPDMQSEILIGAVDATQVLVFSAINKAKRKNRFTAQQIAKLEKIKRQLEAKEIKKTELEDEEYEMLFEYNRLQEVQDDIPFTDEEYEKLKQPLSKYIELKGYDIPPGLALMISAAQIFAPRVADVIIE